MFISYFLSLLWIWSFLCVAPSFLFSQHGSVNTYAKWQTIQHCQAVLYSLLIPVADTHTLTQTHTHTLSCASACARHDSLVLIVNTRGQRNSVRILRKWTCEPWELIKSFVDLYSFQNVTWFYIFQWTACASELFWQQSCSGWDAFCPF